MASVEVALRYVLGKEGGLSDHPKDRGGRTMFGVTQAALDDARKARKGAGYPEKVDGLTREQACDIYEKDYLPKGWGKLNDQRVATWVLDIAVNSGLERAITILQRSLCSAGSPVVVDGKFGPKTIYATNAVDADTLLGAMKNQRIAFYRHIVEKHPDQREFLAGWLNRANDIPKEV